MKMKKLFEAAVLGATAVGLLAGCGGEGDGGKINLSVWVGGESVDFYKKVADEFIASQAEGSEFANLSINVVGTDTGSAAGAIIQDKTAAADIYTVAHDNIGKLVEKACARPLVEESLVKQVDDDNPAAYKDVIHAKVDGTEYLFGAPYISQALFLYYRKDMVTEEQAKTFEGLQEAARAAGGTTKAVAVTGTDAFNFSFTVLAMEKETKATTVKIYEGGDRKACNFQGEDAIASTQWAQRFYADANGLSFPSAWATDIQNKKAVAIIGGAWHKDAFAASAGESNTGISLIPTYTLTEDDVNGTTQKAGTVMQGGTFADCKVFMINSNCDNSKYAAAQALIKYMTSKNVQDRSFKECSNVPAYAGSDEAIKTMYENKEISETNYQLATNQIKMAEYGIAQPFTTARLNTFYYSSGADAILKACVTNDKDAYSTNRTVREAHYKMQYIWQNGKAATEIPETLPADIA